VSAGAVKYAIGYSYTCALFWSGQVRCWGLNHRGQLGYGHTNHIGDDELPSSVGFVDLGGAAVDIAAGTQHTCAVMDDASLKCWGDNGSGRLGYGHTNHIGDDELPSSVGFVDVGDNVVSVVAGDGHTCVLTDQQTVRCWGYPGRGQLGYGNEDFIGDNELPSSVGAVSVGGAVVDLAAGLTSTCVLLAGGGVRCWGEGTYGQLGQASTNDIGDNELPSSVSPVSLGNTPIVDIVSSGRHSCVLYDNGTVRCWGYNEFGQLGHGNTNNIGDNELPSSVGTVSVGGDVDELWVGHFNTCVRIGSDVKCWGAGGNGTNGYASTATLGDNELPSSYGMVNTGIAVTGFAANSGMSQHVCARSGADLRCWGYGSFGALGYGNDNTIGDDETPMSAGNVPYY
jgi:alpha-tubulin suppressor-like RCC1 family protein